MLTKHQTQSSEEEGILGNLLTLILLLALMGTLGAVLYVASGPPHLPRPIPSWEEISGVLQSSELPPGVFEYIVGSAGWLFLAYLTVTILLRMIVDLIAAIIRENPLVRGLRAVSDGLTIPLVRKLIDGILVAVTVAHLLGPDLGPSPVAAAPITVARIVPRPGGVAPDHARAAPVQPAARPDRADASRSIHYLVKRGDTLRGIAARFLGDETQWHRIWEANRGHRMDDGTIFTNPDLIEPSWELTIPVGPRPARAIYVVQPGDALWSIAERELGNGLKWREIWELNEGRVMPGGLPFTDPRLLEPGWQLLLPKPPESSAPQPAPPAVPAAHSEPVVPSPNQQPAPPVVPAPSPPRRPVPYRPTPPAVPPTVSTHPTPATPTAVAKPSPVVPLADGRIIAATFGAALLGLVAYLGRRRLSEGATTSIDDGHAYIPGRFLAALRQRFAAELETDKVAILASRFCTLLAEWGEQSATVLSCLEGRKSVTLTVRCDPGQARRLEGLEPVIRAELHARTRVEQSGDGAVTVALSGLSFQNMLKAVQPETDHALPLLCPIGATEDNRVVHLNLAEVGAALIAGTRGGGADELLRNLGVMFAAQASPRQLVLTLIGDDHGALAPLVTLPHLRAPIVEMSDGGTVRETLDALQGELARRMGLCQEEQAPTIHEYNAVREEQVSSLPYCVIAIDDLDVLLEHEGTAGVLTTLCQDGPRYGIVVIAVTSANERLPEPVLDAFHIRIALRLVEASQSLRVLGQPGAEALAPKGELLLKYREEAPRRLRGLRIEPDEVAECVALMAAALGGGFSQHVAPRSKEDPPDETERAEGLAAIVTKLADPVQRNGHIAPNPATGPADLGAPIQTRANTEPPASPATEATSEIDALINLPLTEEAALTEKLLRVYTLGRYRVYRGDTELTGANGQNGTGPKPKTAFRAKARELLAYFLTDPERDHGRERVQEALWPDGEPGQSQRVFHNTLWVLRTSLNGKPRTKDDPAYIAEKDECYRLESERFWVDAREFEACVQRAEELAEANPDQAALLRERAVALYQGDYLDNAYAEWASVERARLRQMYLRALKKLADHHAARRRLDRAIMLVVKAVAIEPFEEALQRKLLHLYAAASDWQSLIRQYEHLEQTLQREMHMPPDRKTQELYRRLLAARNGSAG